MAVNPSILAKIFGGATAANMDPTAANAAGIQGLGTMGARMLAASHTQTGGAPNLGSIIGQGYLAGQQGFQGASQAAQQQQANQMALDKAEAEKARREKFLRMLGGGGGEMGPTLYGESAPAGAMPSQAEAGGMLAGLPPQAQQLIMAMSPEQQEKVITQMVFPDPEDTPARIQEAREVSRVTGQPIGEILNEWRAREGTNVNVSVGGPQVYTGERDTAFGKAMGAQAAKTIEGMRTAADNSAALVRQYDQMNDLLQGIETGTFTGSINQLAKVGEAIGIDTGQWGENVGAIEAAQALQNQLALKVRNPESGMGLPGATSNRDIKFLLDSIPGITMTREGRKAITEVIRAQARLDRQLTTEAQAYLEAKDAAGETPILDAGWQRRKQQIIDNATYFGAARQSVERALQSGGQAPMFNAPASSGQMNRVQRPAEETDLDALIQKWADE